MDLVIILVQLLNTFKVNSPQNINVISRWAENLHIKSSYYKGAWKKHSRSQLTLQPVLPSVAVKKELTQEVGGKTGTDRVKFSLPFFLFLNFNQARCFVFKKNTAQPRLG